MTAIIKKIFFWTFIFGLALVLQTTVVPKITFLKIYPDLPFILLFTLSIRYGSTTGIWSGFVIGLVIDVFSAGLLGAHALAKTLIGGAAGLFDRKNMILDPVLQLIILLLAVVLHDIIVFVPNVLHDGGNLLVDLPAFLLFSALPRAIYTTVVAVVLFIIYDAASLTKSRR